MWRAVRWEGGLVGRWVWGVGEAVLEGVRGGGGAVAEGW